MIRPDDPQLRVELVNDVAELGSYFSGHIRRDPVDGATNAPGRGQVRAVRLGLHCSPKVAAIKTIGAPTKLRHLSMSTA